MKIRFDENWNLIIIIIILILKQSIKNVTLFHYIFSQKYSIFALIIVLFYLQINIHLRNYLKSTNMDNAF